MPCGPFAVNVLYLGIGMLACNLAQLLKRKVRVAAYRTATVGTLRGKLYRLANMLLRHVRRLVLKIMTELERWR